MRICLYILLLTSCNFAFSQNETKAIIEYKIFNNTDLPNTQDATLYVNGSNTIYLPKPSTRVYKSEKANARPKNLLADWFYVKTDHASKDVFLFDGFGANNFLIKDNYNLTWVISEEVKTVAGYECIKATTNFRALEWEVWFAPEIPLSYGPWKLHGLPGLIMEAHDKNRMFNLSVEKIEYKRSDIFDKPFNTLVETRNKEPILLKDFIEQQDEFYENADAKLNQQLPNSITTPHRRVGYELIYEWEE